MCKWWLIFACSFVGTASLGALPPEAARQRTFHLTYGGTVTGVESGQTVRLWLPVPPSDEEQTVEQVDSDLPAKPEVATEPKWGNRILYLCAPVTEKRSLSFSVTYRVTRREIGEAPAEQRADADERFLAADALVPVGGKPAQVLLAGRTLPAEGYAKGRALYELVDDHMQYRKDRPGWGRGDATWACESGFGNCTDFHSLFISLARSEHLPAKFEIGFAIPPMKRDAEAGEVEIAGYHCWAKFKPQGHGWVPLDISEANQDPTKRAYFFGHLDENRVTFSTGRDLTLTPKQDGPPVNFFVYPYAEVGGKPVPAEQIKRSIHCVDEKPKAP